MDGSGPPVTDPVRAGDERTSLMDFLCSQRELVAWKLTDVDEGAIRAVSTPTGMTALGIVRHLTNVERSWFRDDFLGEGGLAFDWSEAAPDGEWVVPDEVPLDQILAAYATEWQRCDEAIASHGLDELTVDGAYSLRWIILHMIEETARHLGHIDVLREQTDGSTGADPLAPSVQTRADA
jgi:uncharacterized damage-inducible protein DinB